MSDLISRQAAIDALEAKKDKTAKGDIGQFYNTIIQLDIDALIDLPTIDAVEVVRGKWRFEKGDGKTCVDGWVCTNCNCGFHTNVPYFEEFNFCPNCGAKMDATDINVLNKIDGEEQNDAE